MNRGLFKSVFYSLLTSVLSLNIVSAADETNFDLLVQNIGELINSGFSGLNLEPALLTSLLLGILLYVVLYSIVKQMFGFEGNLSWISTGTIALIMTTLTFLYLPENFTEAIALQYSAMGATILSVIPFLILLYFTTVVSNNLFVARVIWIFYVVYYIAIFSYKLASPLPPETSFWLHNIPYLAAILAGIIILITLGYMR